MKHLAIFSLLLASPAFAQTYTAAEVDTVLMRLDPDVRSQGIMREVQIADLPVVVILDAKSDRMRAMVNIAGIEDLTAKDLARLMQANFDTALDARYAVARGRLWGVFIHQISSLNDEALISGLGQSVNLALSYGTTYSSGALSFGGGDSGVQLLKDLLKKGQEI